MRAYFDGSISGGGLNNLCVVFRGWQCSANIHIWSMKVSGDGRKKKGRKKILTISCLVLMMGCTILL